MLKSILENQQQSLFNRKKSFLGSQYIARCDSVSSFNATSCVRHFQKNFKDQVLEDQNGVGGEIGQSGETDAAE